MILPNQKEGYIFVDNSLLELLQECPRNLEYSQILRRSLATGRPGLDFGTLGHLLTEYRYRRGADVPSDALGLAELESEQIKIASAFYTEHNFPEDDWRDLNWAVELFIKRYNQRYPLEPFNLLTGADGKPLVEVHFSVPFSAYGPGGHRRISSASEITPEETGVFYSGKIDLPVFWDSHIIVMDLKTTSVLGRSFWDTLRVSPQQYGYVWAFHKTTGQMPIGFCVNAIDTRPMPQNKPKVGWDQWWEEKFQRLKEYVSPSALEEWENNTMELISELFWHAERGHWPMKKKWCAIYGRCQFYDVCYSPQKDREELLRSTLFEENTWSPIKHV